MNDVINSKISNKAKIYDNIRCVNSVIKDHCIIGDYCDIDNVEMDEKSELGRRNLIRNVKVGKGSYTGTNTIIKNTIIGKYCSIGWNVSIGGGNHNYNNISMYTNYWINKTFNINVLETTQEKKKVLIGSDVWIASGVNIVNGVTIGDGCVIGAGAVVTKNIPPYSIAVGVPAKVIKKRFDDSTIELLLKIQWWNWNEKKIIENISLLKNKPSIEELTKFIESKI